jgi:hypothetical protein
LLSSGSRPNQRHERRHPRSGRYHASLAGTVTRFLLFTHYLKKPNTLQQGMLIAMARKDAKNFTIMSFRACAWENAFSSVL